VRGRRLGQVGRPCRAGVPAPASPSRHPPQGRALGRHRARLRLHPATSRCPRRPSRWSPPRGPRAPPAWMLADTTRRSPTLRGRRGGWNPSRIGRGSRSVTARSRSVARRNPGRPGDGPGRRPAPCRFRHRERRLSPPAVPQVSHASTSTGSEEREEYGQDDNGTRPAGWRETLPMIWSRCSTHRPSRTPSLGPLRANCRSTRSAAIWSGLAWRHFGRPVTPASPARRISSSTALWPTTIPRPSRSSACTRRAP
jgi:hypothetical protein